MDIVCDTNVWYRIEDGRLPLQKIAGNGHHLHITPVSVMELLARIDESSFGLRRSVARTMVEHGACMLRDPDAELIAIWGLQPAEPAWNYQSWLAILANAASFSELQHAAFHDIDGGQVNGGLSELQQWRSKTYSGFTSLVTDYADAERAGYADARKAPQGFLPPDRESETAQRNRLDNEHSFRAALLATYERAANAAAGTPTAEPSESQMSAAESKLRPYIDTGLEFAIRCTQQYAPRDNDTGDRELFAYVHSGMVTLTFDEKWLAIARRCGHDSLLFQIE